MSWCRWVFVLASTAGPIAAFSADSGAAAADPPAVLSPATRPAVPDTSAQGRARRTICEVFQKEYADRTPAGRRELASRLLAQADQTRDDPAARYVLLCEARDVGAGAADAAVASAAIRRLAGLYDIDRPAMVLTAMQVASRAAADAESAAAVSRTCLQELNEAVHRDDYATASRLAILAGSAAEKASSEPLRARAQARAKDLQVLFVEFHRAGSALRQLEKSPDDPGANLLVGRFRCLSKGDWAGGLDQLGKGGDSPLCVLARRDLINPIEAAQRLDLANAWWELAQGQGEPAQRHLEARAVHWYRLAAPGLSGLNRSLAEGRIEQYDLALLKAQGFRSGLRAELFEGTDLARRVSTRVDSQIHFDWGTESPDPSLTEDAFSIRWSGCVRVGRSGTYTLTVMANTGVRLWIDQKLVFEAENLTRKRSGATVKVSLNVGMHALRLEFWDTSGTARMKLLWQPPGASRPEPIPASVLYHDACEAPP